MVYSSSSPAKPSKLAMGVDNTKSTWGKRGAAAVGDGAGATTLTGKVLLAKAMSANAVIPAEPAASLATHLNEPSLVCNDNKNSSGFAQSDTIWFNFVKAVITQAVEAVSASQIGS